MVSDAAKGAIAAAVGVGVFALVTEAGPELLDAVAGLTGVASGVSIMYLPAVAGVVGTLAAVVVWTR